jgi:hypothetical protein
MKGNSDATGGLRPIRRIRLFWGSDPQNGSPSLLGSSHQGGSAQHESMLPAVDPLHPGHPTAHNTGPHQGGSVPTSRQVRFSRTLQIYPNPSRVSRAASCGHTDRHTWPHQTHFWLQGLDKILPEGLCSNKILRTSALATIGSNRLTRGCSS